MATKELTGCIVTGSENLVPVINLGNLYPSAFINSPSDAKLFKKEPFVVNYCRSSGMVQLKHVRDYDDMFKEYWYRSGTNSQMKKALDDIVCKAFNVQATSGGVNWLDIANNDGTLSQLVKERWGDEVCMVGVDPALDLKNTGNDVFVNDYFSASAVTNAVMASKSPNVDWFREAKFVKFDVITNIAMFYDLQDPHPFLDDVKSLLANGGVYVIQMTDLWGMIKSNAIDNFCHEHVAYYSLEVMDKLLKMHGLEIYDFEYNSTNGSSLRLYISHPGTYPRRDFVDQMIEFQREQISESAIEAWYKDVHYKLFLFSRHINIAKDEGKRIGLIGASTKGNTLLQYCGLTDAEIDIALELTPFKFGKFCLGSDILIANERDIMNSDAKPDMLVGAIWHFKKGLLRSFDKYLDEGGSILFPLPTPTVYTKQDGNLIATEIK
jgi:SAM-dependent methyltransferase